MTFCPGQIHKVFTQDVAPEAEVVDASDILADLRHEKSENEFACMAVADKIACAAARAMLAVVKPGLRESQVAAVADYVVESLGGDGYGFETIVNSGDRCKDDHRPGQQQGHRGRRDRADRRQPELPLLQGRLPPCICRR